jgi:ubiquinone/menaquinone biosynthesis C-methylase UbiE
MLEEAMNAMDHRANIEMKRISSGEAMEIVHEQALRDYEHFVELIEGAFYFLNKIGLSVSGSAIDIGSGTGIGASILSNYEEMKEIYALEFSENFVKQIMPLVFEKFSSNSGKIQRVIGDFNNLEVENDSIDLILDIDSLHHAEDLEITLKECNRVLKEGGVLIAIDRAWADSYTESQLENMLDKELNDKLKHKYNIPENQSFTRRDFGEHEYTMMQWENAFSNQGFETNIFSQKHPLGLNRIFLNIPTFKFTIWISSIMYKIGIRRHIIYGFNNTRRLFVCIKT